MGGFIANSPVAGEFGAFPETLAPPLAPETFDPEASFPVTEVIVTVETTVIVTTDEDEVAA